MGFRDKLNAKKKAAQSGAGESDVTVADKPVSSPSPAASSVPASAVAKDRIASDFVVNARKISLDSLVEDAEQARKTYKDIEDLAQSIKENGQLQPIVVEPLDNGKHKIVLGHRRKRAFELLRNEDPFQYSMIKAEILDNPLEFKAKRFAQYGENVSRDAYEPLEEAEEIKMLMELDGLNQKEFAKKTGQSESRVSKHLKLLSQPESVKDEVRKGTLTTSDVAESKVAKKKAKVQDEETRVPKVSVDFPVAISTAKLLALLIKFHDLGDIKLPRSPTRKELQAILSRADEVFKKVKKDLG